MSKGSFQLYQHYLPASYIRGFKSSAFDGKNTVSGFVKEDASRDQIRKRIIPLNATKICGEPLRHTVLIDGKKDNIIEDCFQGLEMLYPDFVKMMGEYYTIKEYFRIVSGQHYGIRKLKIFKEILDTKVIVFKPLTGFHEVEDESLRNISFFMSRFLCYRLASMDAYYNSQPNIKLKRSAEIIKSMFQRNSSYFSDFGAVITKNDWKSILLLLRDGGEFLIKAEGKQVKEIHSIFKKIYRFIVIPFLPTCEEKDIKISLYAAPKNRPIISCDSPFVITKNNPCFSNGCIFTISPYYALIFSKNPATNSQPALFSDLISIANIQNAKKYVFSKESVRLDKFTKNITPRPKASYANSNID